MEDPRAALAKRYFAYPNSLDPMTPTFQKGLIPLVIFAMASLISVFALLCFIAWRLIAWRKSYKEYVGGNQYILLIFNLLIADLQQSIAFVITFHWLKIEKILAPTAPCFVQAWFLHIGDVSSGFFVLAIAVHTWLGESSFHQPVFMRTDHIAGVVKGYRMSHGWLIVLIVGIWGLAVLLTVLGPALHGNRFFTRAGGWVSYNPSAHHSSVQKNSRTIRLTHDDSAGYQLTSRPKDYGCTTCGSSLWNLVPL